MTNTTARLGLWTPFGQVLCYKCHGASFNHGFGNVKNLTAEEMVKYEEPIELVDGRDITTCNNCGREIQVYDDVAQENNLAVALNAKGIKATLQQTGGMNSACEVDIMHEGELSEEENKPYYMLKYHFDSPDGEPCFSISKFDTLSEWVMDDKLDDMSFKTIDEAVAFIVTLPDIVKE